MGPATNRELVYAEVVDEMRFTASLHAALKLRASEEVVYFVHQFSHFSSAGANILQVPQHAVRTSSTSHIRRMPRSARFELATRYQLGLNPSRQRSPLTSQIIFSTSWRLSQTRSSLAEASRRPPKRPSASFLNIFMVSFYPPAGRLFPRAQPRG